jgi:AraC-like DNA-binding protein
MIETIGKMHSPTGNPTTVSCGFVVGLISGLSRTQLSAETLLERAEIASDSLHDPSARITVARYAALYRRVSEALDEEGFALFSRPLRHGSFEFLCRATLSAGTLEGALDRITRYLRIVLDDLEVEVQRSGNAAVLIISEEQALPVGASGRIFAFEWLLRMIHGVAAWLVAHPLPLDEVAFPYPPPLHAADYELVFAPRYTFDAPRLEARFPSDWLSLPVRRDEAALRAFLVDAPASITTLYRRDRALAQRVRDHLRAALPEQPTLPDIARRMFMSPRTLHRRLEEEGTQFRNIKEGLRRDLASEWLTKSTRPLQRIGADLGFADAASFYRAFSGWAGCGPREFRRRSQREE